MSNFTRSILYSTTVMVAGLIGIFTIYNNVDVLNDGSAFSHIAPAANKSDIGVNFGEILDHDKVEVNKHPIGMTAENESNDTSQKPEELEPKSMP